MKDENLIKAMRETMRRQSQAITSLHQQIEILNEKISQKENEMNENNQQTQSTTPTHGWGVVTETVDGGFNGRPETQDRYIELHQWRRIDRPKQTGWFDDTKERAYYSDPGRIEGRTVYVKKVDN